MSAHAPADHGSAFDAAERRAIARALAAELGRALGPDDRDDLAAVAEAALWEAAEAWDGRGVLRPFAVRRARRRAVSWLQRHGPYSRAGRLRAESAAATPFSALLTGDAVAVAGVAADGPPPDEAAHARTVARALAGAVRALPERERRLVALRLRGHTKAACAEALGVSGARVSQLLRDVVRPALAPVLRGPALA